MNWVTIPKAAASVNRSPRTIYNWIKAGRLHTRTNANGATEVDLNQAADTESKIKRGRPVGTARPPTTARRLA